MYSREEKKTTLSNYSYDLAGGKATADLGEENSDSGLQMLFQGHYWDGYFKGYHPVKSWTLSSTFLRSLWNGNKNL